MDHCDVLVQHRTPPPRYQNYAHSDEGDVEEVERGSVLRRNSMSAAKIRSFRNPAQCRIRVGKPDVQMLEITTTMDSRRSMEGSDISCSSNLTMATSATSSNGEPWSSTGFVEDEDDADADDYRWDDQDNEVDEVVPKLEPLDDVDMADFSPASDVKDNILPETPSTDSTPALVKRPRGRPRKHPKPSPETLAKVAKGRSKTGCITCRRRKKKCDETKPGCMFYCPTFTPPRS